MFRSVLRDTAILIGMLALAACSGAPTEPDAATASLVPAAESPHAAATEGPDTSTTPPTIAAEPDDGWLVFSAAPAVEGRSSSDLTYTLWGVRADGSGLTQINDAPLFNGAGDILELSVSPDGQRLATFTARDSWHGLALALFSLPNVQLETITPLTSAETELPPDPYSIDSHDPRFTIHDSLTLSGPAWSPDGKWLAFTSAYEGPSIDLHIYSMESGAITRLSEEPFHAYNPFWSPDSQTLLFGELEFLGVWPYMEQAAPVLASVGVYAAAADGSSIRRLYDGPNSYGDVFIGWTGPTTFAVYTSEFNSGPANLRVVDVDTGAVMTLVRSSLHAVALDPISGALLYSAAPRFGDDTGIDFEGGTYLRLRASEPERLLPDPVGSIVWLPVQGVFVAQTGDQGTITITPDGSTAPLDAPAWWTQAAPVPVGQAIAWYGIEPPGSGDSGGLWIGEFGEQSGSITEQEVRHVVWTPDGQALFYVTDDDQLYYVRLPDGSPERIGGDLVLMWQAKPVWLGSGSF